MSDPVQQLLPFTYVRKHALLCFVVLLFERLYAEVAVFVWCLCVYFSDLFAFFVFVDVCYVHALFLVHF